MRSILTCWVLLLIAGLAIAAEKEAPAGKESRKFEFTYTAKIETVPEGAKTVDLWVPLPQSNKYQSIGNLKIDAPVKPETNTEPKMNNKMAHWKLDAPAAKGFTAKLTFECKRKEVSARDVESARELTAKEKEEMAEWLKSNKLVLVGGSFVEVADAATKGKSNPYDVAKATYDYTVSTMKYDKPKDKAGWGKGSTQWACDAKFGNCTDFHAMIMSIGRTKGIPVKFEMGFPIPDRVEGKPETTAGPVGGYHCWAQMYLGGVGWVPVDASEAQRHPKMIPYYFGNLTPSRVQFTVGRDVDLVPKQAGEALNYFIYPYAEADGKSFAVEKSFGFRDVE